MFFPPGNTVGGGGKYQLPTKYWPLQKILREAIILFENVDPNRFLIQVRREKKQNKPVW